MMPRVRMQIRSRAGDQPGYARRSIRAALTALAGGVGMLALLPACGSDTPEGMLNVRRVLGETGIHPGQFRYPRGMDTFDFKGRPALAIVDKTSRIQIIDLDTGESLGSLRTLKSDLGMPTGLTVAPFPGEPGTQALWVADTHNHQVIVYRLPFDHDGQPTAPDLAFGSYGHGPGQFVYPTDIAVDAPGGVPETIYVSEYGGNDRVSVFRIDPVGTQSGAIETVFQRQIGISGTAMDAPEHDPAALSRPQSITLRDDGRELVVVDAGRHRVIRFDIATGEPIAWTLGDTDSRGGPAEPMRFPYGLTLLDKDRALVSEFGGSTIRVLDLSTGATLGTFGAPGRNVGQLANPWASFVIADDLVILDSGNDRVQVVAWEGVGR
jgi:sugar lactone lactonase YvrE